MAIYKLKNGTKLNKASFNTLNTIYYPLIFSGDSYFINYAGGEIRLSFEYVLLNGDTFWISTENLEIVDDPKIIQLFNF